MYPSNGNGLVQLIRVGYSILLIRVNAFGTDPLLIMTVLN